MSTHKYSLKQNLLSVEQGHTYTVTFMLTHRKVLKTFPPPPQAIHFPKKPTHYPTPPRQKICSHPRTHLDVWFATLGVPWVKFETGSRIHRARRAHKLVHIFVCSREHAHKFILTLMRAHFIIYTHTYIIYI